MSSNNATERTSLLHDTLREARDTELIAGDTLSSIQHQGSLLNYIMDLVNNISSNTNNANIATEELERQVKERTHRLWMTFIILTTANLLIMVRVISHGRIL